MSSVQSPPPPAVLGGFVHGGATPISGAEVDLYAAGAGGYGTPARPVLSAPVTTDASGSFSIPSGFTCQPGDQVYLLATGGMPAPSTSANSSIALAAALGSCSAITPSTSINVNEVTTVAAAYALAAFMSSPTGLSSSGTPLALTGVQNAFLNAANLASVASGQANATTPGGNGTVPVAEINTVANILAACVDSTGTAASCSALFTGATPPGGKTPTDTFTAALNIAHYPGQNVSSLFGLNAAAAPFQPSLTAAPHDWSLAVTYTGGGIGNGSGGNLSPLSPHAPYNHGIAVDGLGNVWVANLQSISVLDPAGKPLSPASGFTAGIDPTFEMLGAFTLDSSNNAWFGVYTFDTDPAFSVLKMNSAGTLLSPAGGYTGGGLYQFAAMTFDSAGNLWVAGDGSTDAVAEFNSSGIPLSPSGGYASPTDDDIFAPTLTADTSGHVWWVSTEFGPGGSVLTTDSGCAGLSAADLPVSNAVDANGDIWSPYTYQPAAIAKCSPTGALLSPTGGFPISSVSTGSQGVAVDGNNDIWFFDLNYGGRLGAIDTAGNLLAPAGGYQMEQDTGNRSDYIALDPSGNAWVANQGATLVEFVGIAAPVVTPLATALATKSLGARP